MALFNEKGFDATTIDDISSSADVAKGTFFNYFPRKESVIEFLADEWMVGAEETASDRARSAIDRLQALYAGLTDAYEANPELSRTVMRASAQRMCCPAAGGSWQRFEELVIRVLSEGQERGEIRADVTPQILHGVLVSCFVGSVMWWLGEHAQSLSPHTRGMSLRQVVHALQRVALDGMVAARA